MDKKEIWLPVKGYEGLYEVSSFGRVRSIGKGGSGNSKMRIMSPRVTTKGYLSVQLWNNGIGKNHKIHRIVAEAFIPNWFDDTQVNHRDENKHNNHIDNLEWCSSKYNSNYGTRNERITEKMTNGKLSKPVLQFTKTGEFVREWPSSQEVGRNGFDNSTIRKCCNGKRKSHNGFVWKYKSDVA